MRINCPVCNSIQTKLSAQNSVLLPFTNYKCKNCGNSFVVRHKPKGGCLWSLMKITLYVLILGVAVIFFLIHEASKEHQKDSDSMNTSSEHSQAQETENISTEKKQTIKDSLDPSDTLSIKTEIRKSE